MTTIFSESVYEPKDKWWVNHYCDDVFSITKYSKDKTINQMREMLFFESQSGCTYSNGKINKGRLSQLFFDVKNSLKDINRELYELFYREKVKYLDNILERYGVIKFIQVPKCCSKIKIINGRFVWTDGNSICFIGETNDAYYVANWYGS
jgi:hypothetical protein